MEIYELKDKNLVSSCCSAPVYANTDICSRCKEHCKIEKIEEEEFCGNCGIPISIKEAEKCNGFCQDCYENEIIGMKYG